MQSPRKMFTSTELRRTLSTRQGMFVVAGLVTVLAAAFLMLFLNQYRARVTDSSQVNVAIAKGLIEKGSSGDVIVTNGLFEMAKVKKSELASGAVTDPAKLRGKIATNDIFPGNQLKMSDFAAGSGSIGSKITGYDRAISIPLDSSHGLIGDIGVGDRVDVLAGVNINGSQASRGRPVIRTILQNALVLKAPSSAKTGATSLNHDQNVVVRASDKKSAEIAFAADNGKVWLVLRPKAGALQSKPSLVGLETLLVGSQPLSRSGH
jgi:Flp pilus assembly protein CpaB